MSDAQDRRPTPLPLAVIGTLLGVLVIFAMLAAMLAWWPDTPVVPEDPDAPAPRTLLEETRARDRETLTTYGWVDREEGVVRIPAAEAMEKLLAERGPDGKDR